MPLSPGRLLCLALLKAAAAFAGASVQYNGYTSSDGLVINSPSVGASLDLDARTKVSMDYGLDAVSAASFNYSQSKTHRADPARGPGTCYQCHFGVDALSGASRTYREERHQVTMVVQRHVGEHDGNAGYTRSQENDYLSESVTLGAAFNFFDRNTTLTVSGVHMADRSTPVWLKSFSKSLYTNGVDLGVTQVFTRLTQGRLTLSYADAQGYLADPYAFVKVLGSDQPVPARHPAERQRVDAAVLLKQALPGNGALEADYRYYSDSWDVRAHTVELAYTQSWGAWLLEPSWRYYTQTQAAFFKNFYSQVEPLITRDLKLAAFQTQLLGVELRGAVAEGATLSLRYSHYQRMDQLDYRYYFADAPPAGDAFQAALTLE
jgi:hypothetical protein